MQDLTTHAQLIVRQRKELIELLGFETRNKYEIDTHTGQPLLYAAEVRTGFLAMLARQFFGHWRRFEVHFFDTQKQMVWKAVHPFRWIFQRLDVYDGHGVLVGCAEWKWGLFRKRFRLYDARSQREMMISSGFFSFWTFPITHQGRQVGQVQKQWSGALREIFTDADSFAVEFGNELSANERMVILSTSILIDLQYFERKGSGGVIDLG